MTKGAVGVGTLIVFIAIVLVASITATVILNTSQELQIHSYMVGKGSIRDVVSTYQIISVLGIGNRSCFVDGSYVEGVEGLIITAKLIPGAEPKDINHTTLIVQSKDLYTSSARLNDSMIFQASNISAIEVFDILKCENSSRFAIRFLTPKEKLSSVIEPGDVFEIIYPIKSDNLRGKPACWTNCIPRARKTTIILLPAEGLSASAGYRTPVSITVKYLDLYP